MRLFGLIGFPLSHSFSEEFFRIKFADEHISGNEYRLFPIEKITYLPELIIKEKELCGLNITIPYKIKVINYLHEIDETALEIGSVNTIKIIRNNDNFILKGYNTDVYGFEETLKPLLKSYHTKALILGTGGASRSVAYVLNKLGISYSFISREPKSENHHTYKSIDTALISSHLLIINTTPLGMYPATDSCPDIPYDALTEEHVLYDLVYNPAETLFLKKGKEKNAVIMNGLPMLHLQAEKSWQIWNS